MTTLINGLVEQAARALQRGGYHERVVLADGKREIWRIEVPSFSNIESRQFGGLTSRIRMMLGMKSRPIELLQDRTIYLISEGDADGEHAVETWIGANFEMLFEMELEGWYTTESLWPQRRTSSLFHKWFEIEFHSMIIDTVGDALYYDEE